MDLKDKTIFDFTDDKTIIKKITGGTPKDFYIQNCHPVNKLADIVDLAYLTNDTCLKAEAEKAWKNTQKEWDNTIEKGQQNGIIID
jgi:hypothetical protein